jgi:RES domain-containing protein
LAPPHNTIDLEVYRITHKKWATKLSASGYAARWNSTGVYMIYAAENRSLACLENLVHRNGFGLDVDFCVMTILIPKSVSIEEIQSNQLPENWNNLDENAHLLCRTIGDNWIREQTSCVLLVPSAIIEGERNIIFNPNHKDFKKITIKKVSSFAFDNRLMHKI